MNTALVIESKVESFTTDCIIIEYDIKTSGSESWGQEEGCTHVFKPTWTLQQVIYMDGSSKFLKYSGLATITAIA